MSLGKFTHFHLVGIKGVAMTSLAQLLVDAGKTVTGVDVAQDFVTAKVLGELNLEISNDFSAALPLGTECVVYTAAHQGPNNPQVKLAGEVDVPVFSHAEALSWFFNNKAGIAVCGVGGKSTTSAMIAFIFAKTRPESFSVGVGNIAGLNKTGQWLEKSKYFVAEADEYVTDPAAVKNGQQITPRFSYLHPQITVCTNLQFDHPDVYKDFAHTKDVYRQFFSQLKVNGHLIINGDDNGLTDLVDSMSSNHAEKATKVLSYGSNEEVNLRLIDYSASEGRVTADLKFGDKQYKLILHVPGKYNLMNAMAALLACHQAGIDLEDGIKALADFKSTLRRFELIGEKNGVIYYDDYAHHPREIKAVLQALAEWYPARKKIIAFQSHTFSRTKQLFNDFVESFDLADKLIMIDIFASAREEFDESVSSDNLCKAINVHNPKLEAQNLGTINNLANYLNTQTQPGDVILTIGAGDIYQVHDLVE